MMDFETTMLVLVGVGLAITALAALVRIVRGPTILDRMVASDVLLTTVMLALGADMVVRNHTDSIPLMIAIAATATFATIVVARYVKRRAEYPIPDFFDGSEHRVDTISGVEEPDERRNERA